MDKVDVLMKEYDIMRSELRIYLNRFYLAFTAIGTFAAANIFKLEPQRVGFVWIYMPYVIAVVIGFMTIIAFYVTKVAGYIHLIEERINNCFNTTACAMDTLKEYGPPNEDRIPRPVPILLWENFYADIGIERGHRKQPTSLYIVSYLAVTLCGMVVLVILVGEGCAEARKWQILGMPCHVSAILHGTMSLASIWLSSWGFWYVQTNVRRSVMETNRVILSKNV